MGDTPGHLRKTRHNKKFLRLIKKNDSSSSPIFPDWMVTTAFYIALHHVDAKLAKLGIHPINHGERNTHVATRLGPISADYIFLKNKSVFARYYPDSEKIISPSMVSNCLNLALTKFK